MALLNLSSGTLSRSPGTSALALATRESDDLRGQTSAEHKATWGQFFTGQAVAAYMAALIHLEPSVGRKVIRVLDPGAGTGVLGLAASEFLLRAGFLVHLVAVEPEPEARARLAAVLERASKLFGDDLTFEIRGVDFLDMATPRLGQVADSPFDVVISNPPYFKMSPELERGGDAPNAYARFMEVGAALLRRGGQLVYIVPRSFASGPYFKNFRARFHALMALERVHVFESRRDAFRDEQVLQENVIVSYIKSNTSSLDVTISCSSGVADLDAASKLLVRRSELMRVDDRNGLLAIPTCQADREVMRTVQSWPSNLSALGLDISTGPVVPFRTDAMRKEPSSETVPLLWLQHVRQGKVRWPLGGSFRKQEYLLRSAGAKLLVPRRTYILMRRFSSKEESRRLTLAVLDPSAFESEFLGLENHLNYIHCPRAVFSSTLAWGVAAVLSSSIVDSYFRILSGNTQVSATEIRSLPLPPREVVEIIGKSVQSVGIDVLSDQNQIDQIVSRAVTAAR